MQDPLTRLFAALADPTRRDLVARLTERDATVGELAAPHPISLQAISKHVSVLTRAGLVSRPAGVPRSLVHLETGVFQLTASWLESQRRRAEGRHQAPDSSLPDLADRTETRRAMRKQGV